MKTIIGVVCMAMMFLINSPNAHSMFGHTAEERQRRIAAEQQLSQEQQRLDDQQHLTVEQQQRASRWQTAACILGIVAVITLIAGTAIGSKGRHDAARGE